MNILKITIIISLITLFLNGNCQTATYSIQKTYFSFEKTNEFSPVYFKDGIVYCTDRNFDFDPYSTVISGFFKMSLADTVNSGKTGIFSKKLNSKLNDGPATFSRNFDTVYFSRNRVIEGNIEDIPLNKNKLGIYFSVYSENEWSRIREFRFNSEWYNITTPFLSPDGSRLYFSSDKEGGFGGSDLYYCQKISDFWENPVNLGPVINTSGNESYPFINEAGELFFSSDGHKGIGKKDIYFSKSVDSVWLKPALLEVPVNSEADDFGFIINPGMTEGYFTSNRDKSYDIYSFKTLQNQVFSTLEQKKNQSCFRFSDPGLIGIDTNKLQYKWNFGDGYTATGEEVIHCYIGPGKYEVSLDIIQPNTGKVIFSKLKLKANLKFFEQPFINSVSSALISDTILFNAVKSNLPGHEILGYTWDFGDSSRAYGEIVKHRFSQTGVYDVKLGVKARLISTGVIENFGVYRQIFIFDNPDQQNSFKLIDPQEISVPDLRNYPNLKFETIYSAEEEYKNNPAFTVELLTSKADISLNNRMFHNLPKKYSVKKNFIENSGLYSYTTEKFTSLTTIYPVFREIQQSGFQNAKIRLTEISPAEKELNGILSIYGTSIENYFDKTGKLTAEGLLMLDQLVKLMNKYPLLRIEITAYSDDKVARQKAQTITNYLINRSIKSNRLLANGFNENDRKQNRRIEFRIIDN